jgi:undecaprenyl phosphate N,N'-diacetylbacillosamine 1-phosphate transferase
MSFRIRDMFLAGLGLILLSPLFLLLALGLWLTQERVFFTQMRPGLNEKPFRLLKFSTLHDPPAGGEKTVNKREKLTPLGKYLRATSLDELPQLLNVLKGEMSLVGPRPLLTDYLPLYTQEERKRHSVRPGITGWAQVNGRNQISFKQKFAHDLWYVENRSHTLDLKIIWLTIAKVFKREGVYADGEILAEKYDGTN